MSTVRRGSRWSAHSLPPHDRWLLSYADFVTLLLAVFIVLFASVLHRRGSLHSMSAAIHSGFETLAVGSERTQNSVPGPLQAGRHSAHAQQLASSTKDSGDLAQHLQRVLGDAIRKHEVVVQQTSEGVTVRLQELGFFDSGEAALLPGAAEELRRIAEVMRQYNLELRIEGHSDDQPIHTPAFHSNWELSTARAMSVVSVLVNQAGVPPERVAIAGYGPYRPIADNATEEGRRMNRRVDLVLLTPHTVQSPGR